MKRNRCRYCGVTDPAGLRFDRSYTGESNYVCIDIESCVERIKRFAKQKLTVVPVLAEPSQRAVTLPRQETPAESGEAREAQPTRHNEDSRGGSQNLDQTSRWAAGNGAQGDPATAGSGAGGRSSIGFTASCNSPRHSFTDKQMRNLLALGL